MAAHSPTTMFFIVNSSTSSPLRLPAFKETSVYIAFLAGLVNISILNCPGSNILGVSEFDDYRHFPLLERIYSNSTSDTTDAFDRYEIYTRQRISFVVAAVELGSFSLKANPRYKNTQYIDTQVICVAPDNVTEGSRVPEIQLPSRVEDEDERGDGDQRDRVDDQSTASHTDWGAAERLAVYAAAVVGLLFVIY